MRIPGWASGKPVPGDLYYFQDSTAVPVTIKVNGKIALPEIKDGYALIERVWKKGDSIEYDIPMRVNQLLTKDSVTTNADRMALQRGPLVYCLEAADNAGNAWNVWVPSNTFFSAIPYHVLDEPVIALSATIPVFTAGNNGTTVQNIPQKITAIPYYTWCNRGKNSMQVWLPTRIKEIKLNY